MTTREKPILFSGAMVRAILDGRKTQTRRIVKGAWHEPDGYLQSEPEGENGEWYFSCRKVPASFVARCPYGREGDRLWVRETFQTGDVAMNEPHGTVYRATDPDWGTMEGWKWKPAIHMPRWASRITLEITQVRVQRLQDISEDDAKAEGVEHDGIVGYYCDDGNPNDPEDFGAHRCNWRFGFKMLWESINAKRGYGWEKNPWVWAISFRRVQ